MEVIAIIAVGIAALFVYEQNKAPASSPAAPPASPVPSALRIGSANPGISGGYRLTSPLTSINGQATAFTATTLPSTVSYPPVQPPAPALRGGIAGTVGTGGRALGSGFRTALTSGTGTTVVPTTPLQMLPRTKVIF